MERNRWFQRRSLPLSGHAGTGYRTGRLQDYWNVYYGLSYVNEKLEETAIPLASLDFVSKYAVQPLYTKHLPATLGRQH